MPSVFIRRRPPGFGGDSREAQAVGSFLSAQYEKENSPDSSICLRAELSSFGINNLFCIWRDV